MLNYNGHPKSSALLYWANTDSDSSTRPYYASFLTVSPVELHDEEQTVLERLNFSYPIMIHEPIPVKNMEKIIQESRERNATIIDCGNAGAKNIKAKMKNALAEYLNAYISFHIEMEHKKEIVATEIPKDLNFQFLKEKLTSLETSDKINAIVQLTGAMRSIIETEKDPTMINHIAAQIEKLRLAEEYDFDRFLHIVRVPGKIAHKMTELYIRQFHNITSKNKDLTDECREDIASLFTLKRLDELREQTRDFINHKELNKAIRSIEQIYRIKESDPPFASGDDLDRFCKDLTEEGTLFDDLSSKYIEKYFLIIDKRFTEAGEVHRQISTLRSQKDGE